jgi:hypothetical protein
MVEQQSVVFQNAIRRVIARLEPERANELMELLSEEMSELKSPQIEAPVTVASSQKEVTKVEESAAELDKNLGEFE